MVVRRALTKDQLQSLEVFDSMDVGKKERMGGVISYPNLIGIKPGKYTYTTPEASFIVLVDVTKDKISTRFGGYKKRKRSRSRYGS